MISINVELRLGNPSSEKKKKHRKKYSTLASSHIFHLFIPKGAWKRKIEEKEEKSEDKNIFIKRDY